MRDWIVTKLTVVPPFSAPDAAGYQGKVEVYKGSEAPGGQAFLDALFANRSPYACVHFNGSRSIDLEEGEIAEFGTYIVWVAVKHDRRSGLARTGESIGGAPLALLTCEVVDWLKKNDSYDAYRVSAKART